MTTDITSTLQERGSRYGVSKASAFLLATCPDCGHQMAAHELITNRARSRGYRCDKCRSLRTNQYRVDNSVATTMSNLLSNARRRSIARGVPFSITLEDVKQMYVVRCPLLRLELNWQYGGKKKAQSNSPSIDRIFSTGGYTPDNTWIISHRANMIKSNASAKELSLLAANFEKLLKRRLSAAPDSRQRRSVQEINAVIELRASGCSFREIERITGVPKSTAAWLVRNAFDSPLAPAGSR